MAVEGWLSERADDNWQPNMRHQPTIRERRHRIAMRVEQLFGVDLSRKHFTLVSDA